MVCSNVSFSAVNSPHLSQFTVTLCPKYLLPSPTMLQEKLLPAEYASVLVKQREKIAKSHNLTLTLDGWTDVQKRSILAFVLLFLDRKAMLLETEDVSDIIHSAEHLAGGQGGNDRLAARRIHLVQLPVVQSHFSRCCTLSACQHLQSVTSDLSACVTLRLTYLT